MIHALRVLWCKAMHRSVAYAGYGGEYECRTCGLRHAVSWAKEKAL